MTHRFQLAQFNIGRLVAPLDSPAVSAFVERLDEINALAERSPGFVWRLKADDGMPSSYLRPYDDDRVVVTLSVWESVESLEHFVYKSLHAELFKRRRDWFEHLRDATLALWWIPAGHLPGIDEAKRRLAHLAEHGPSQFAFTFKTVQPPDEPWLRAFDWSTFEPCPG